MGDGCLDCAVALISAFCSSDGLAMFALAALVGDTWCDGNMIEVRGLSLGGDDTATELSSMNRRSALSSPPKMSYVIVSSLWLLTTKLFGRSVFNDGLGLLWNPSGGGRISCDNVICALSLIGPCGGSMSFGEMGDVMGVGCSGCMCRDASMLTFSVSSKLASAIFGIASTFALGDFFTETSVDCWHSLLVVMATPLVRAANTGAWACTNSPASDERLRDCCDDGICCRFATVLSSSESNAGLLDRSLFSPSLGSFLLRLRTFWCAPAFNLCVLGAEFFRAVGSFTWFDDDDDVTCDGGIDDGVTATIVFFV